jgi:asparagine synthase (glutamine-hydrolysing)
VSGFAVIYDRSNSPVEPILLQRAMDQLKHRGPDGSATLLAGHFAFGHWHFWTTPEEVGERQPLQIAGMPFKIVLDGRLDNRQELLTGLNLPPSDHSRLSDAGLILHAYERWGEHCFEHFIGEYALVILNELRGELLCARDALGDRTLFYTWHGTNMVVASEPWAVAIASGSSIELNESVVALYFGLEVPQDGQTLFRNVYELLPAQVMVVSASSERRWKYWQPDPTLKIRGRSDEEYGEEFCSLLEESVRCRLRATTPAGVLMSGGLDSTSVASLAARTLAPHKLTTISYVFDELSDCDERRYIEAVKVKWDIHSIQIPCDDAWPLKDWQNWPRNPNQPEGNPYRLLKERAYHRAKEEGLRVLLTGGFGDQLYSAGIDWLADLAFEAQIQEAGRELSLSLRLAGVRWTLQAGYLQRLARRLLNILPGGTHLHLPHNGPSWLTKYSAMCLFNEIPALDPVFAIQANILGIYAAKDSTSEIYNASRHALELRHPYRDRRLVEYVLALPAYQLYRGGLYKHILRTAMQGILPEPIRTRRRATSMVSLFMRGMDRERDLFLSSLQDPDSAWRKYIRADWLANHWNASITPETDGPEALVAWLCISYDRWYNLLKN